MPRLLKLELILNLWQSRVESPNLSELVVFLLNKIQLIQLTHVLCIKSFSISGVYGYVFSTSQIGKMEKRELFLACSKKKKKLHVYMLHSFMYLGIKDL